MDFFKKLEKVKLKQVEVEGRRSCLPVEIGDEAECGLQMFRAAGTKVALNIDIRF